VFTTRTGRPIEPRAVGRRFDLRCAKVGVRRIRVHDTWRTCGSLLAAFDVHPRVAMRILRHSKIAITMELCTMVPDQATLAALSDALGSADAALPDEGSRCPLLYTAAVYRGQVFKNAWS
jgi:integrase